MAFWDDLKRFFGASPAPAALPEGNRAPEDTEQRRSGSIESQATPLDAQNLGALFFRSKSGVNVNEDLILSIPAFFRAAKIVTGVIASLPLEVVSETDGIETVDRSHSIHKLLNLNPSPLYSRYKFFETLALHLLTYGNFYAIIRKSGLEARPKTLTIVDKPNQVTAKINARGELVYTIDNQSYKSDRVIHISNLSWNGILAMNLVELHRDNYGLALANRDYGNTFYANGAHLAGVLRHPGRLTQEAYSRLRSSWESRYGGADNVGKTAILEEGMDYQAIGLNPTDAAFSETKKLTVADISLITGVPRFMLEESDPTFNNGETITRQWVNYSLLPTLENIESELNRKLFFDDEMETYRVRFNLNQLLRADTEQRGRYIDNLMKWGIINRDEARKMEGWNPIEDGSGEAYLVPLNMVDPTKEPTEEQLGTMDNQTMSDEEE